MSLQGRQFHLFLYKCRCTVQALFCNSFASCIVILLSSIILYYFPRTSQIPKSLLLSRKIPFLYLIHLQIYIFYERNLRHLFFFECNKVTKRKQTKSTYLLPYLLIKTKFFTSTPCTLHTQKIFKLRNKQPING